MKWFRQFIAALLLWPIGIASAAEPLPDLLMLDQALALASTDHPDIAVLRAQLALGRLPLLDAAIGDGAAVDARSAGLLLRDAKHRLQLEIAQRFFDVLLADLRYARDDEAVAIAFIMRRRAQSRYELGQVSDIELGQQQSRYQQVLHARRASQAQQRSSRLHLALTLNRPRQLPAEIAAPAWLGGDQPLPDLALLEATALGDNLRLQVLRGVIETVELRLAALAAGQAQDTAVLDYLRARLRQEENELRQALLEAWSELGVRRAQLAEARAFGDYRELYLDRSRALYELAERSDLGDAMVEISTANLRIAEAEYGLALARGRLRVLTGQPPYP